MIRVVLRIKVDEVRKAMDRRWICDRVSGDLEGRPAELLL
jgi:hypothetical protein